MICDISLIMSEDGAKQIIDIQTYQVFGECIKFILKVSNGLRACHIYIHVLFHKLNYWFSTPNTQLLPLYTLQQRDSNNITHFLFCIINLIHIVAPNTHFILNRSLFQLVFHHYIIRIVRFNFFFNFSSLSFNSIRLINACNQESKKLKKHISIV